MGAMMNPVRKTALAMRLAIGIISALGIGSAALAEDSIGVTVYGKANVGVINFDNDGDSGWELSSNASRLGFKGSMQLNGALVAIYKLEYEVFFDDGVDSSGNSFKQRNTYIGLQGRAGTLFLGKHDTALKMAQLRVDRFNDLPFADIAGILIGENRLTDIINYTTPKFGGLFGTVQLVLNEGDEIFGDGKQADGLTDSISSALNWQKDPFNLALAYDKDVVSRGRVAGQSSAPFESVRFTGEAVFKNFELGALYEQSKDRWKGAGHRQQTTDGYVISGALKSGNWKLYAHIGQSDMPIRYETTDNNRLVSVGVDYSLARSTKITVYYSKLKWEDNSTEADLKANVISFGLEHKF
jgi:predicted porin